MSTKACIFYDMQNSNNAARIRLWLRLKGVEDPANSMHGAVERKLISFRDMKGNEYKAVNPLGKVPAFLTDNGTPLFESFVIMQYLEDRFKDVEPCLIAETPDDRAVVQLLVRVHDVYISSPNCTQPNFSHTQGCMYLAPCETKHCPKHRTMDVATRAAKLAEIHKWLVWLEQQIAQSRYSSDQDAKGDEPGGPHWYLAPRGHFISHADLTWFPTAVFMEYHLPRVFGWGDIFHEKEHFPLLAKWFGACCENKHFQLTRAEIRQVLESEDFQERVLAIKNDVKDHPEYKWKYM